MPRLYFDIHDGEHHPRDDAGSDLSGRAAARKHTLTVILDITRDESPDGDQRDFLVDVRDETGKVFFSATLSLVARWLDH